MVYHVFVSYRTSDRAEVEPIVQYLRDSRLAAFFDEDRIDNTRPLDEELAWEVNQSGTFLLCMGTSGLGATQLREADHAYTRAIAGKCYFVTLLLPGVSAATVPPHYLKNAALVWKPLPGAPDPDRRLLRAVLQREPSSLDELRPYQTGPGFPADLKYNDRRRSVTLYPMLRDAAQPNLELTWETWAWAISRLEFQIKGYPWSLEIDAYFGINEAGLAIAMALNHYRRPIGFLFHRGHVSNREIVPDQCLFPPLCDHPRILLVDSELKAGTSLKVLVPALRARYPHTRLDIYYAVLVVRTASLPIASFSELEAWDKLQKFEFEDIFVCCLMAEQRVEMPKFPK